MADRFGTARTGGLRRATVAGTTVAYRLEYIPGSRSLDPDDERTVVGGLAVEMRVDDRDCVYG